MKYSSILVALAATVVVSSQPIQYSLRYSAPSYTSQNHPPVAGAAYFITNEPDGNFIIGNDIADDGKLTFKQATWAGGRGAHGLIPTLPDPLFSQGAIIVAGQNVFTINAGSNTVAMFSIDPEEPAKLRMIGQPVDTGGEFPVSVTVSKQSGQVCVLNGGKVNGVNCFKQDPMIGLVQMADTQRSLNLNATTPPSGPPGTVSHIIFNKDGSQLLASVKGEPPLVGFIASWAVDPISGALSADFIKSTAPPGGGRPFAMTFIPGKEALLVADPIEGFDIFDYRNASQASSTAFPIPGQMDTCWSSLSRTTGNFYLTDVFTSIITEVNVDNNLHGTIVKQYPQGTEKFTIDNDIVNINGKDFLYVLAPGTQSVAVFSLDAPGQITPVQQFSFQNVTGVTTNTNNLVGLTVFLEN